MMKRLATVAVGLGALAFSAGPALAHVTVDPGEAAGGGFEVLTFKVPNESATANTVEVSVTFPEDHPFSFVSVQPKVGWTYVVEKTTLDPPIESHGEEITEAVSAITWSGGTIAPGEYDEFKVSVGPVPEDADALLFPAVQTYDDGDEVRWIEETPESGEEPEFPAPMIVVTAAEGGDHGEDGDDAEESAETADLGDLATTDDVDSVQTLAIIGVVLGGIGVVLGGIGFARRRSG
jgi:uncharacterized protein YcnI